MTDADTKKRKKESWSLKELLSWCGGSFAFGVTATLGILAILTSKEPELTPMATIGMDNPYQLEFKKKEYVKSFYSFFNYIEEGEMDEAWEMLSNSRQKEYNYNSDTFINDYIFTAYLRINYLIPITEGEDEAAFYVYYTYTDMPGKIDEIRRVFNSKLSEANSIKNDQLLIAEIENTLGIYYETSNFPTERNMTDEIKSYISNTTLPTFVYKKWSLIPLIANVLNLEAKNVGAVANYYGARQDVDVFSEVIMKKDETQGWKVKFFRTRMIERWE